MNVFLSWSGNRSGKVANFLSEWLGCVIQVARPWVSNKDIDRGALWFGAINDQLRDTTVGIICVTQENKDRPWILFEAGALAKGLPSSRVCTFLVDLLPRDISDPLAQFNHTLPEEESVHGLMVTLNNALGPAALNTTILDQVFHTYWPQFDKRFKEILADTKSAETSKPRPKEDMLAEILENTRTLASKVRRLESDRYDTLRRGLELEKSPADETKLDARLAMIRRLGVSNNKKTLDILKLLNERDSANKDSNDTDE